jgi:hypothetical protein
MDLLCQLITFLHLYIFISHHSLSLLKAHKLYTYLIYFFFLLKVDQL